MSPCMIGGGGGGAYFVYVACKYYVYMKYISYHEETRGKSERNIEMSFILHIMILQMSHFLLLPNYSL